MTTYLNGPIQLSDSIMIEDRSVKIMDVTGSMAIRKIPDHIEGNYISTIGGNVFIDGYQLFMTRGWKRTLRALWHRLFNF